MLYVHLIYPSVTGLYIHIGFTGPACPNYVRGTVCQWERWGPIVLEYQRIELFSLFLNKYLVS